MGATPQNGDQTGRQYDPGAPFSIRLLERNTEHANEEAVGGSPLDRHGLLSLLPASYHNESGDLAAASQNVTACIEKELDLQRLSTIHSWLWMAGRPMPHRALHDQLLLRRDILITERMDMHLVWTAGRIFLKPLPRFLLEPPVWTEYLGCEHACGCSIDDGAVSRGAPPECERRSFRRRALGFLFSYAALISHESDFRTAEEKHLLPSGVRWPT